MTPPTTADDRSLRQAMVDTCRAIDAKGINQGTAGNLSLRHGDGFLITPSSLPYDTMQAEDIVEMGWDGTYVGRRPSSEWRFHRDILKARTDMNVVLHCHSLYATSVACHHRTIPAFHYMVGVMGGTTATRCGTCSGGGEPGGIAFIGGPLPSGAGRGGRAAITVGWWAVSSRVGAE